MLGQLIGTEIDQVFIALFVGGCIDPPGGAQVSVLVEENRGLLQIVITDIAGHGVHGVLFRYHFPYILIISVQIGGNHGFLDIGRKFFLRYLQILQEVLPGQGGPVRDPEIVDRIIIFPAPVFLHDPLGHQGQDILVPQIPEIGNGCAGRQASGGFLVLHIGFGIDHEVFKVIVNGIVDPGDRRTGQVHLGDPVTVTDRLLAVREIHRFIIRVYDQMLHVDCLTGSRGSRGSLRGPVRAPFVRQEI